eukprot:3284100-Prymnesium_polylepis.1
MTSRVVRWLSEVALPTPDNMPEVQDTELGVRDSDMDDSTVLDSGVLNSGVLASTSLVSMSTIEQEEMDMEGQLLDGRAGRSDTTEIRDGPCGKLRVRLLRVVTGIAAQVFLLLLITFDLGLMVFQLVLDVTSGDHPQWVGVATVVIVSVLMAE